MLPKKEIKDLIPKEWWSGDGEITLRDGPTTPIVLLTKEEYEKIEGSDPRLILPIEGKVKELFRIMSKSDA